MTIVHAGKYARRAALVASTALFATCAPSSISGPPMRAAPEGPALAGRRISMVDATRVAPAVVANAARGVVALARIASI
jgi:hypothetical protein